MHGVDLPDEDVQTIRVQHASFQTLYCHGQLGRKQGKDEINGNERNDNKISEVHFFILGNVILFAKQIQFVG